MRYLILLFLFTNLYSFGQENQIISLLNSANIPTAKEYKLIGYLDSEKVKCEVICIEKMDDGKKLSGMVFSILRNQSVIRNVLDTTEITTFEKTLTRLSEKLNDEAFRRNEFAIKSTAGITLKGQYSTIDQLWVFKLGLRYEDESAEYTFGPLGLQELIDILGRGQKLINSYYKSKL